MRSTALEGASSHKETGGTEWTQQHVVDSCNITLTSAPEKNSWRCSFHLVTKKENLVFRGRLRAGGRCTAWNDPVVPEPHWRVAQCTRYATGCTNADQLDQDQLWSREGWQVGGRIETKQDRKLPGSATRQYMSIRSVRKQSQSHTPRQRPSARRSH